MAKKSKDDTPNPNSVPNRDIIQRLNFLYQASSYLNGIGVAYPQAGSSKTQPRPKSEKEQEEHSGSSAGDEETDKGENEGAKQKETESRNTRRRLGKRKATTHDIARSYVKSMKIIGQKTNVKMDPSVKRTMCKGCNTLLMPGVTAKVRVKPLPSHGHAVNYTCINCSFSRRIPAPPTTEQAYQPSPIKPRNGAPIYSQDMNVDNPVDELLSTVSAKLSTGAGANIEQATSQSRKRKENSAKPRPVPFFAKAEHILFVGNDRVGQSEGDNSHN